MLIGVVTILERPSAVGVIKTILPLSWLQSASLKDIDLNVYLKLTQIRALLSVLILSYPGTRIASIPPRVTLA